MLAVMDTPISDFGWLPDALEPVALRLARADACAFKIGDMASKWSLDGPLHLEQVRRGEEVQTFLKSLRPVPPETSLLFSEAVNHLRASIDNVVWYLTEQEHGNLSGHAASLVSMPISDSPEAFKKWTSRREKEKIHCLGAETTLGKRLRTLQPFVDLESVVPSTGGVLAILMNVEVESAHPLRLLQAYSNADKHRSIRLAAARTFSSTDAQPLLAQDLGHKELRVGDPMGPPSPWGQMFVLETSTAVMVQRPWPFGAWANPVKELTAMRRHIAQFVIPTLLQGSDVPSNLPPVIELGDTGHSNRERIDGGLGEDAEVRLATILRARYKEAETRELQFAPVVHESAAEPHE